MKLIWETKPQPPLDSASALNFDDKRLIELTELRSLQLCYPAARSQLQPFSKPARGVVKAPSVEAPPSAGAFPAFRLPAGGPEVELSLTAWAQLRSLEQLPRLSPRARPAPGTPPGIVILPSPNIRRSEMLPPTAPVFNLHPTCSGSAQEAPLLHKYKTV